MTPFRSTRLLSIGAVAAVVTIIGCSSNPDQDGDILGSSAEALATPPSLCGHAALTTIDTIPAYANTCGNVNVWSNDGRKTQTSAGSGSGWVQTEGGYGYQCTELASRYMHFRYGTTTHWGIAEAKDMCATNPTDVSKTTSPVHGDLMVFAPNKCVGAAGHVAVISSTTSSSISVVQQNETASGKGTYSRNCALCYLHAERNNVCGDVADGSYCGNSSGFSGGKKGTLYVCKGHAIKSSAACADGCDADSGTSDECIPDAGPDAGPDATNEIAEGDDAGSVTSADDDARAPSPGDAPAATSDSGGCAISARGSGRDPRAMLFVALGLVAVARRRRSRRS